MRLVPFLAGAAVATGVFVLAFPAARAGDPPPARLVRLGNATCPVKGTPIDPKVTTIWNGMEIAFCCSACKPRFDANPDAYAGNIR